MNETVKQLILEELKELEYKLGCYDEKIESIKENYIIDLLDALGQEYCDIAVLFKNSKKWQIVEISTVDNEKDIITYSLSEYQEKYRFDDEYIRTKFFE